MGYVSRVYMAQFPKLVVGMIDGDDGDQNFASDLAKALDLDAATFAYAATQVANGERAVFKIDLGAAYLVDHVRSKIGVWANNNFATAVTVDVDIDVSLNGTDWTEIDSFTDTATLKNSADVEVQDTAIVTTGTAVCRYIRIDFQISVTAGTDNEVRVYELNVIGYPITEMPVI